MTTAAIAVNNEELKCFICLESGNLKSANICCGPTVYHPACFSRYCSEFNSVCPICKESISDKLRTTTKITDIDRTKLSQCIGGILYGIIVVWSLVMVSLLKQSDNLFLLIISCILSPLLLSVFYMELRQNIKMNHPRYLPSLNCLLIPTFASYVVLLITSSVSYYHPSLLTTYNVINIFILFNSIVPTSMFFLYIISILGVCIVGGLGALVLLPLCLLWDSLTTFEITVQDDIVSNV